MATITTRSGKGSPLTNNEVDANFTNLNDDKQEVLAEGSFADGDKTKLDGIEAGADVTDTANVTAAGALMDSEVTNLAQVKAFDSSDYATAAQGALADTAYGWGDHASGGYLTSYTETDPVVGAVSGIVKANGAGTISAAAAGTDYLTPTGDGSGLTGINAGKILKYETGSYTTENSIDSSSFTQFTGIGTISFQPSSSDSVIVFIIFSNQGGSTNTNLTQVKLERSSSSNLEVGIHSDYTSDNNYYSSFTFTDVFTNSGTSAVSYKLYGRNRGGGSPQSMRINRNGTNGTRWIFMELEP